MRRFLFLPLALNLTACDYVKYPPAEMMVRIAALETQIVTLQSTVNVLSSQVRRPVVEPDPYAAPDCGGAGYDITRTRIGSLVFFCREAKKYLDGTKLYLSVGNPTTASLSNLTLTFEVIGRPDFTVERKISTPILPGTWTKLEAAVPGLSEAELGQLMIRAKIDNIGLSGSAK
jgi:hypothetical protein